MPAEISTPNPHEIVTPFDHHLPQSDDAQIPLEPLPPLPASVKPDAILITENGQMQLTSIESVWRAAKLIRLSGLCPKSFASNEQVVIAILRALELKLPVFQALEGMTVINGRLGVMGDLALAIVEASGKLAGKHVEYTGQGDELACTVTLQRKGRKAQPYSFSVAEARQANIYERSQVWKSYPKRMCYYRALGFGLRDEFSDVLKGTKTVEELQDYPS